MDKLTYKKSGVDIEAGNELVERIKPIAKSTTRKGADVAIGGFGGLFDLKPLNYKDPILISSTDGVGTKLKLAIEAECYDSIGIDLVAMCVNDIIVQGAEPLFFLDYYATSKLNIDVAEKVIASIANGCIQAECALIGGETAEMPGMYHSKDFDLAGFAVGVVERAHILPKANIEEGDVILAVRSSGLHANGFSLVRKILEQSGYKLINHTPFDSSKTFADALLEPTRIYVKQFKEVIRSGLVKALAHITGGGLIDNIPRILPNGLKAVISKNKLPVMQIFEWLKHQAKLEDIEMYRTFNCGVGMVVIVSKEVAEEVKSLLDEYGEEAFEIGFVAKSDQSKSYVEIK